MIQKLYETYVSLQTDCDLLAEVRRVLLQNLVDVSNVDEMQEHNFQYRRYIENYLTDHFPDTLSELRKQSQESILGWLKFWKNYPALYFNSEEKLICLFWQMLSSLSDEEWQVYGPYIKAICTNDSFARFAAVRSREDSLVSALYAVVKKCADPLEQEQFFNKVECTKNELS